MDIFTDYDQIINMAHDIDSAVFALGIVGLLFAFGLQRSRLRLPAFGPAPLYAILALAGALRVAGLDDPAWYDEAFSAGMASMPLSDFGPAVLADVHPPLYYIILRFLPSSDEALRLPALLSGMASVWATHHVTQRLTRSNSYGLIAAGIMAVLPAHIRYSVEARGYMLLTLLVQVALYASITRRSVLFAGAVSLLPLIHAHGFLYAAALGAGALWQYRRRWLPVLALSAVPGASWLPVMLHQSSDVANGFWLWDLSARGITTPLATMTVGTGGYEMFVTVPVVFILSAYGIGIGRWIMPGRNFVAWAAVAVGVPAAAALISFAWRPVYLDRALLPAVVLFVPLWAVAIQRVPVLRSLAMIALPLALITYLGEDGRLPVDSWLNSCTGDVVYTTSTASAILIRHHDDRPVYVSANHNAISQHLPPDILESFGVSITDRYIPGPVCVAVVNTADNWTPENISDFEQMLDRPHRATIHRSNELYEFVTIEVIDYGDRFPS